MRNNNFKLQEWPCHAYGGCRWVHTTPPAHPRDHRLNYRGDDPPLADLLTPLPDGASDAGADRGIAAFIICASLFAILFRAARPGQRPCFLSWATSSTPIVVTQVWLPGLHDPISDPQNPQSTAAFTTLKAVPTSSYRASLRCGTWPPRTITRLPYTLRHTPSPKATPSKSQRTAALQHLTVRGASVGSPREPAALYNRFSHHDRVRNVACPATRRTSTTRRIAFKHPPERWSVSNRSTLAFSRSWRVTSTGPTLAVFFSASDQRATSSD